MCVCLLVTFVSPANTAEPIEMPFVADAGGPKESCIRWVQEATILGLSNPLKSTGSLFLLYTQKQLNRSRCYLGADSSGYSRNHVVGSDESIRSRKGDRSAIWPFAKLLWSLLIITSQHAILGQFGPSACPPVRLPSLPSLACTRPPVCPSS